jgi:hypothetical protein
MKVKLSFVTNSSSTAYLAIIPKNFTIGNDLFTLDYDENPCWKEELEFNCDNNKLRMLEYVSKHLSILMNNNNLWIGESACFMTIRDYLKAKGLIFKEIEIDGNSGGDIIEPISIEELQSVVEKYYKMENSNNETKTGFCNEQ